MIFESADWLSLKQFSFMKYVLLIVFVSALFVSPATAQTRKTFTINPGQKITDAIPKEEIFIYPEFVAGTVYFKSETAG